MVSQVLEQPRGLVTQVREGALSGPTLAVFQVLMQLVPPGSTPAVSQVRVCTKDFQEELKQHKEDYFMEGFKQRKVDYSREGFTVVVRRAAFLKAGSSEHRRLKEGSLERMLDKEQGHLQASLTVDFSAQAQVLDKLDFREQVQVKLTVDFLVQVQVLAKLDFLEQVQILATVDFLVQVQVQATVELQESQAIQPSRIAPYLVADSTLGFPRRVSLHTLSLMWDLREAGEMEEQVVTVHQGG